VSALLLAIVWCAPAHAQTATGSGDTQTLAQDLKRLTIEELSQIDVTSVPVGPKNFRTLLPPCR
jgi:hypothetical protein